MILNAAERAKLTAIIVDLEAIASFMAAHSATKDAIYRNAADLRKLAANAAVTKMGRSDGHSC